MPRTAAGQERRRTQTERTEATTSQLAQAAFELIRDQGYASFRVARVAQRAGVSLGGQLHHFPTKDSITMAAIDHAIATARERTDNHFDATDAHTDLIAAMIEDFRDYYFSAEFDVAMDVVKSAAGNAELRRQIASAHRIYRRYAEQGWLDRLVGIGWNAHEAGDLVAMTASLVRGFAIRAMIRPDRGEFERLARRWRAMVTECFVGAQGGGD